MKRWQQQNKVQGRVFKAEGNYDLHVHTTASDGVCTPVQLIDKACRIGLAGLAITDHDTVDGLSAAAQYIKEKNLELDLIPGIEMNTELDGFEIHILGYYIDISDRKLLRQLEEIKHARYDRAYKMVEKLRDMGLVVDFHRVEEIASDDLIARPHIARALLEKGYVLSEKEAFDRYISQGIPAYIPRYKFEPAAAISLIKSTGGISVLAHPGLLKNDDIVNMVINMGIEGIEVYYPEHDKREISKYLGICEERDLLVTGGSDFHGGCGKNHGHQLGAVGVNVYRVNKLKGYINRKK